MEQSTICFRCWQVVRKSANSRPPHMESGTEMILNVKFSFVLIKSDGQGQKQIGEVVWNLNNRRHYFYKTFKNNMWVRPAKCFLTWSQRRQIILCRILKQRELHQGQYNPYRDVNPVAATLRCSCAHVDSFSVYPPWLITHGCLFISCFFFYALAIWTVCSVLLIVVTVFQHSSRLTQFTAGYECRKYGSSTHQREMKSLWGKSGQTGAMSWFLSDW